MKTRIKPIAFLTAFTFTLLSGCAGITEPNLGETDRIIENGSDAPVHQELPDFFNNGDQEDIIEIRPGDSYEDRP